MTIQKEILSVLTNKEFRGELRENLVKILSKHVNVDLTMVEAITIIEFFNVGLDEVEKEATA